jgi:hypothetical protein
MWSYYGTKKSTADLYPKPRFKTIIEPFAGAAGYSMLHFEHDVKLFDKYEIVVGIWKYLQQCSKDDILKLPNLFAGDKIDDIKFDCKEQKHLYGFIINSAQVAPAQTVTSFAEKNIPVQKKHIANSLFKIKHWKIELTADYSLIPNEEATWHIDPPYQTMGTFYVKSARDIHFPKLGEWCRERQGQVMVCENMGANWLDFKPLKVMNGIAKSNMEAIWLNEKSVFDNKQMSMFE